MSSPLNTPWTVDGDNEGWSVDFDDASMLCYASFHDCTGALLGFTVATDFNGRDSEVREAIVVAVNCHDELLAAVTAFTDALKAEKAGAMLDLRDAERLASKALLTLSRIPDIQIKGAA